MIGKKIRSIAALAAFLLLLPGCIIIDNPGVEGSGVMATEEREVEPFTGVVLEGSEDIVVTVGEPRSVTVEADDNLLELVLTEVRRGSLRIWTDKDYRSPKGIRVLITVPELEAVAIAGSGDMQVSGVLTESFDASVTGSGSITVEGRADRLEAMVTGSGDLHLLDLEARRAEAFVTGSGDIELQATEELDASVTGSGDIRYRGDPGELRRNVTGSGDIEPA